MTQGATTLNDGRRYRLARLYSLTGDYLRRIKEPNAKSHEIGPRLDINATQIRRDLSDIAGEFGGKRGVGYDVHALRSGVKRALGNQRRLRVVLVADDPDVALRQWPHAADCGVDVRPVVMGAARNWVTGAFDPRGMPAADGAVVAVRPADTEAAVQFAINCGARVIVNLSGAWVLPPVGVRVITVDPWSDILGAIADGDA